MNTQALSGAGFLKMINKATDAVSKMTIKMNESDVVSLAVSMHWHLLSPGSQMICFTLKQKVSVTDSGLNRAIVILSSSQPSQLSLESY